MSNPKYDERLWFRHQNCQGKHYLIMGNPHTFPGRMLAWCTEKSGTCFVSKSEVAEMSELSGVWIDGFLAGAELPPPEGSRSAWEEARLSFHEVGRWPREGEASTGVSDDAVEAARRRLKFDACKQEGAGQRWLPIETGMTKLEDALNLARTTPSFRMAVFCEGLLYWRSDSPEVFNSAAIWGGEYVK